LAAAAIFSFISLNMDNDMIDPNSWKLQLENRRAPKHIGSGVPLGQKQGLSLTPKYINTN
jgi:hypothetical protein